VLKTRTELNEGQDSTRFYILLVIVGHHPLKTKEVAICKKSSLLRYWWLCPVVWYIWRSLFLELLNPGSEDEPLYRTSISNSDLKGGSMIEDIAKIWTSRLSRRSDETFNIVLPTMRLPLSLSLIVFFLLTRSEQILQSGLWSSELAVFTIIKPSSPGYTWTILCKIQMTPDPESFFISIKVVTTILAECHLFSC